MTGCLQPESRQSKRHSLPANSILASRQSSVKRTSEETQAIAFSLFRSLPGIHWVDVDPDESAKSLAHSVLTRFELAQ